MPATRKQTGMHTEESPPSWMRRYGNALQHFLMDGRSTGTTGPQFTDQHLKVLIASMKGNLMNHVVSNATPQKHGRYKHACIFLFLTLVLIFRFCWQLRLCTRSTSLLPHIRRGKTGWSINIGTSPDHDHADLIFSWQCFWLGCIILLFFDADKRWFSNSGRSSLRLATLGEQHRDASNAVCAGTWLNFFRTPLLAPNPKM